MSVDCSNVALGVCINCKYVLQFIMRIWMNTGLELMILVSGKTIVVCKDIFNGEGYFCCTYCNIREIKGGKYERWMLRPPRKSIPTEARRPVQRMRRYCQKCVVQSLARKVKKGKNNPIEHYIYPFAPPTPLGRFVPFLARRVRPPT